mgnify:CR=1 FL=1
MALLFDESYYLNAKLEQLHAKGEMDASGKPYTMESLVKAISDAGLTPYSHYNQYGCREGLDPSSAFDQSYYLASKLAQLHSTGETDANGNAYTMASLTATLAAQGMSPLQHYLQFGRDEGLNPNAWFNESEYLNAKLAQLHSTGETDASGDPYTLASLQQAISDAGMTPLEHYEQFGHAETNADGTLINPSNAFDANAYVAAKLYQLQTAGSSAEQAAWADKSPADVLASLEDASLSPVSHYVQYGADEANAAGVALVQTVPSEQRVSNDPLRNDLGQNVPSNYNDPTPGPDAAEAAPVTKPADMGGLAAESISPGVVPPETPVAVPGDDAYVAPTPGTVDTNEAPVVPETDPDSGLLVFPDVTPEPEPEPEPGTPGGGTSPSEPSFSVTETDGTLSFTGVKDGSISLSVQDGTATFMSGGESKTVTDFSSINTIILDGNTLKADLADLNERTVTGGTVEGTLPGETITTNKFDAEGDLKDWTQDRAEPQSFTVNGGQLQQVIEAPADGATNDTYYAVQGYKLVNLGGGNGVSSMSIDLTIPEGWLNLEVPDDVDAIRLAGFWGRGGNSADDYPLIDVVFKNDKLGFYAWDTVAGKLSSSPIYNITEAKDYTLGIQVANGMYAYSINGEVLGSTPIDEDPTLPLSTVYLQGYNYDGETPAGDKVIYAAVADVFEEGSYTITWDNFTITTASPVTGELDLSGISGLKLNAPLSVGENATLTINAEQANELIIIGKGDVVIDATGATEGVKVDTVEWAGYSGNWYNDKGFADGQLAVVTGSSEDDFFSLDLADIGTLSEDTTGSSGRDASGPDASGGDPSGGDPSDLDPSDDESASDNTISFTARNGLSLNGGEGNDTLMLTWFAPKGATTHTLTELNANNLFDRISGFETIIFNKGNQSNNLRIDASSLETEANDVTNLTLQTSATITGINEELTIGFTEENLTSAVNLDLTPADDVDNLTLAIQTTGTGYINLTVAKSVKTINFTEFDTICLQDSTIIGTSDGKEWKVRLSGVTGDLSEDGTLTINNDAGA